MPIDGLEYDAKSIGHDVRVRPRAPIMTMQMKRRAIHTLRSRMYIPTLREAPQEAVLDGYKYLVRGGYIRKSSNGIYTYLPLAWRSLSKLEGLIQEEMAAAVRLSTK